MTPPVVQGVRAELEKVRARYFKAHQNYIFNSAMLEKQAKEMNEDADCCLVMLAKIDQWLDELPTKETAK